MKLLLQARIRGCDGQSRRSALRHTARVCLRTSRLRVPVSLRVCTLSQRTFMNSAGLSDPSGFSWVETFWNSLGCDKSRSTSVSSGFPSQENLGGSPLLRQGVQARSLIPQGWGLIDLPLRATFSPTQPRARRDALLSQASTVSSCAGCEHRRSSGSLPSPSNREICLSFQYSSP
jgi:hypothetical protein